MTVSRSRPPLMALDDALAQLLAQALPLGRTELVDTFEADGRVLAQDLVSALHVPPQDNSAMDGYALRVADVSAGAVVLPVSQRIAAGQAPQPLAAGTAARIFTGAPLPPGADAVVMQEDTEALADGAQVRVLAAPGLGQWVRRAGEDVPRGATILRAGERLGPAGLGLAAAIGFARLPVAARLRVALFSTGDELHMPGDVAPADMPPGAIYNSNRFFLRALLQRLGCVVQDLGIVPDKREATVAALAQAAEGNDLVISSGGMSVGEQDHVKPAVQQLGALHLWQIAMKPGKPFAFGHIARAGQGGHAHFVGLPGNPVSSFATFLLLVRPLVLHLMGATALAVPAQTLRADFAWPRPDKRREFLRVRRNAAGGLDLFANQSSGVLTSVHWADGLVDVPAGHTIAPGDAVRFIALEELQA